MNSLIITLCAVQLAAQQPFDYSGFIFESYKCKNAKEEKINPEIITTLTSIESDFFIQYDIPEELRGMLLVAACHESGYNPLAKGDWRVNKKGKRRAKAIGILQFWPWVEKRYNFDRNDYKRSAYFWMAHIVAARKKDFCSKRYSNLEKWISAWTQVTRGRLTKENKFRCGEKNNHYKLLMKWKKRML